MALSSISNSPYKHPVIPFDKERFRARDAELGLIFAVDSFNCAVPSVVAAANSEGSVFVVVLLLQQVSNCSKMLDTTSPYRR